jgi:hypothetical protein
MLKQEFELLRKKIANLILCSLVVKWKTAAEENPFCVAVDIPAFNDAHLKLFQNVISV